jgi:hypothetical protein
MMDVMMKKFPKDLIMSGKTQRYFGALIERVEDKLDLILERLDFSDEKFKNLEPRMDNAENRLDKVELQLMDGE